MSQHRSFAEMDGRTIPKTPYHPNAYVVKAPAPKMTAKELEIEERRVAIAKSQAETEALMSQPTQKRRKKKKPRPRCDHCNQLSCGYVPAKCRYCEENICRFCIRDGEPCSITECDICGEDFGAGEDRCRNRECWDCGVKCGFTCTSCFTNRRECDCFAS